MNDSFLDRIRKPVPIHLCMSCRPRVEATSLLPYPLMIIIAPIVGALKVWTLQNFLLEFSLSEVLAGSIHT